MAIEFQAWPKTPRLFREIVVTEKLDGTNSAVIINELADFQDADANALAVILRDGKYYEIGAQSRKRVIAPGKTTDNYGFAAWVQLNADELFDILGPGRHYGEWWGKGIQKRYPGTMQRGFALFNVDRHAGLFEWLPGLPGADWEVLVEPVITLYRGEFSEEKIHELLASLAKHGSVASPFDQAEGVVVFHTQSRQTYKYTLDGEDKGKWEL